MKRLSWKYIAGLVDGEGCIDLQLNRDKKRNEYSYVRPRLRIAMASPGKNVLDMLHANFGGQLFARKSTNPNWDDAYSWELVGKRRLRPVLQNIVNHLYIKKEQARFCIWIMDDVQGKLLDNETRERLKDELKAMKRDPQRSSEKAVSTFDIPDLRSEIKLAEGELWSKRYNLMGCRECGTRSRRCKTDGLCERCAARLIYDPRRRKKAQMR